MTEHAHTQIYKKLCVRYVNCKNHTNLIPELQCQLIYSNTTDTLPFNIKLYLLLKLSNILKIRFNL